MMRTMLRTLPLVLACCAVFGKSVEKRPRFEVASVKPSSPSSKLHPSERGGPDTEDPGQFTAIGLPLSAFVKVAWLQQFGQYSLPAWMSSEWFDVVAKVPAGATRKDFSLMLQNLLEERFKLVYHIEKREIQVYELVVTKGGPKMKQSAPDLKAPAGPTRTSGQPEPRKVDKDGFPILAAGEKNAMALTPGAAHIRAHGHTSQDIARVLTGQVGRPVIDKTGLMGEYDYTLVFNTSASSGMPHPPPGAEAGTSNPDEIPSLTVFGAIENQLGLKLNSAKGTREFFIVDKAEKVPTAN